VSKKIDLANRRVIISRTDSIGDVILTLPLCYYIKNTFPNTTILFLGRNYTRAILEECDAIDEVHAWDEMESLPVQARHQALKTLNADVIIHVFPKKEIAATAKKAKIPIRIGTSHRTFHLLTCNHRVNFTRKNAIEHESQLNFHLLRPFGKKILPSLKEVNELVEGYGKDRSKRLPSEIEKLLESADKKVILHPKSKGSAIEWPLEKYLKLANKLSNQGFRVFFSGTEAEGKTFRSHLLKKEGIFDISGKLSLLEFIMFIRRADHLVACSTGPLHIAAISGVHAIGLYMDERPIHPGRWKPIGENVDVIAQKSICEAPKHETRSLNISVDKVLEKIELQGVTKK
jgi:ADP-heptose:LPS heptosyltransferase